MRTPIRHSPEPPQAARAQALFNLGYQHHQSGDLNRARECYEKTLQVLPGHINAWHLLGVLLVQAHEPEAALPCFNRAIALKPDTPLFHANHGKALTDLGQWDAALKALDSALQGDPGLIQAHNNRGVVLRQLGRLRESLSSFERALALDPRHGESWSNLGISLMKLNIHQDAIFAFERATDLRPQDADARHNLGVAHLEQRQPNAAIAHLREAIALRPDFAAAYYHLGNALLQASEPSQAIAPYRKAIALIPDYAEAHLHLAIALKMMRQPGMALRHLHQAAKISPDLAEVWHQLGETHHLLSDLNQARESYKEALRLRPNYASARWALAFSCLSGIESSRLSAAQHRAQFAQELDALDTWFSDERLPLAPQAVGSSQPFQLAYYEENNRDLLQQYGRLCHRLMSQWQQRALPVMKKTTPGSRVRVGIISAHLFDHSVWHALIKGWLSQLEPVFIELHDFTLGQRCDKETEVARRCASHFYDNRPTLAAWAECIQQAEPDVILYPEIGMDPLTLQLASLRLAPVQIASWGHPETTGLPTIDYYLSAEAFETAHAQSYYSEQLLRLPQLGCYVFRPDVRPEAPDFSALGLDPARPLFICAGTPYKYGPQYDALLLDIAADHPEAQFVFFEHASGWSAALRQRLEHAFIRASLSTEKHIHFLPWMPPEKFFGLMRHATLYLDTPGFSGFNTAIQALICGLPIITLQGKFLRSNLAAGILRQLTLDELITHTTEDYRQQMWSLMSDRNHRRNLQKKILEKIDAIFEDPSAMRSMETLLISLARREKEVHA
jgi:predicted O-linked N-acetylglucosamine transferase (SPINDLY family)